ncbi:hypothetical protein GLOTRDRAFT_111186 [Gloeophyllum trabeum ATCC 11539]|uniref:Uncharacterized protein n=1 Tax=Gloeophyllum trabeum (strain ATCC 11539 / FP-39264 / Madison 617) TaxID=670483 RepID=S7Q752_GLOTA|nr:uncharacterized protein GLOTRDRAFT_111186 [Gloeophyllum trabeum ATCC 11539]EPQ55268.1 hypothetical protein GLOTRDRAFT_111186 [Gloeophyllum trabeum ATCC 11539]
MDYFQMLHKRYNIHRVVIHQTSAQLAGSRHRSSKKFPEQRAKTSSSPPQGRACSQSNERAPKSSSGFEGCGMCKHARLELVPIK